MYTNIKTIFILAITYLYCDVVYSQKLYPFRHKNKWFYVDSALKRVDTKTYSFVKPFVGNYAVVKIKSKYAIINKTMHLITKPIYDEIYYENGPPFWVKIGKVESEIDKNGKEYIRTEWGCGGANGVMLHFHTYTKNNKIGILDYRAPDGVDSLEAIYEKLEENYNGYAFVKVNNKWGAINYENKVILPFTYDSAAVCSGIHPYCASIIIQNGLYGYVDWNMKEIIKPKYVSATFFKTGFALVLTHDKYWGYIDQNGKEYFK